jgi:oligopeptide transport system substrate-binding protein
MMRLVLYSLLCFLIASSLSACGAEHGGPLKDTLRMNLGTEPPSLDWSLATDNTSLEVLTNLGVGLAQFRDDLSCAPACAESWDVSPDGKRYVFHLRKDAKWSDGKPLLADDFKYSWIRLLTPGTAGPYAFFLYDVVNALDYNKGKIKDPNLVGISCPDEHTLEVHLQKPAAYFVNLTTMCSLFPMRKDIVEKFGNRWTNPENIVVDGPFTLKTWQHEYKIELVPNQYFFEGPPKIKLVQMFMIPEQATAYALYENDQLDYVDNHSIPTPEVQHNFSNPEYLNIPLLKSYYIGFNVKKKPFDDKRIRLAISKAIDRTIFPKILRRQERPASTFLPEGFCGYTPKDPPGLDPTGAKKLLAEAGYPDAKGFPRVEIYYSSREDNKMIMEAVQDQLKQNLNLHVELQNQEFKVFMNSLYRDPPAIFFGNWGADYGDPETFGNVFASWNKNNHTLWTSPVYDQLIAKAEEEQDMKKRLTYYTEADHLLSSDEAAVATIFNATENILCKPWVHGVKMDNIDLLFIKDATVDNNWTPTLRK